MSDKTNELATIEAELAEWVAGKRSWCDEHHGLPDAIELTAKADAATIALLAAKREALRAANRLVGEPTDEQVAAALSAYNGQSDAAKLSDWSRGSVDAMRAALTAAGVAPQAVTHATSCLDMESYATGFNAGWDEAVEQGVAPQAPGVEDLIETRAGLALANTAWGEGFHAAMYSVNTTDEGEVWEKPVSPYSAPLLAMIKECRAPQAPSEAVIRAEERATVIQQVRDAAEIEHDQTDEYGGVEQEGYLTIGTRELAEIEGDAGLDRIVLPLAEWEALHAPPVYDDAKLAEVIEDAFPLPWVRRSEIRARIVAGNIARAVIASLTEGSGS